MNLAPEHPLPEVEPIRHASREMVRELGLLRNSIAGASVLECHALLEISCNEALVGGDLAVLLSVDKSTMSRTVAQLARNRWVREQRDPRDGRRKLLALTATGARKVAEMNELASAQVDDALGLMPPSDRLRVSEGLALYARALRKRRAQQSYSMRPLRARDDPAVGRLIRNVLEQWGLIGPGTAFYDEELDAMSKAYTGAKSAFWVVEHEARLVGCGGFAPLPAAGRGSCELRKMYFAREARGLGLGALLLARCIDTARTQGYRTMWLETLDRMADARRLYVSFGFEPVAGEKAHWGHAVCDSHYRLLLK